MERCDHGINPPVISRMFDLQREYKKVEDSTQPIMKITLKIKYYKDFLEPQYEG